MKYKVIITGSTGMVGNGVLIECLESDLIEKVLVINRSSINMNHPKLTEIILEDFNNLEEIRDKLVGYDGCFHSMGVSSLGVSKDVYENITYDVTIKLAKLFFGEKSKQHIYICNRSRYRLYGKWKDSLG